MKYKTLLSRLKMGHGFLQVLCQAVISNDNLHGHREKNNLGNADCSLPTEFSSNSK